ncbi:hypothetical protein [Streptomyces sp. IB201691-2A2]|uniref:hypothetical protein n=1 Tax=Streptomyces sp. IB201691-2A2 TaxID=2561920 RepID=UPI00163D5EC9|nr:hypothetical protein [Streptomyces sp. IB201691-2A2]
MGLGRVVIHLVDMQQRLLLPLSKASRNWSSTLRRPDGPTAPTLSEWKNVFLRANGMAAPADGAERLGAVEPSMSTPDTLKLRRCRTTALIITSKRTYNDTMAQRMRDRPMHLPTEMVRALLPTSS